MSLEQLEKLIKDHKIEFVDLRFADMRGVQHHVTFPKSIVDATLFEDGKMFDGSSIGGWRGIQNSDMVPVSYTHLDVYKRQTDACCDFAPLAQQDAAEGRQTFVRMMQAVSRRAKSAPSSPILVA